jgi:FixJ family two-component response regulator
MVQAGIRGRDPPDWKRTEFRNQVPPPKRCDGGHITRNITVYVVDDDDTIRDSLQHLLRTVGLVATTYKSPCEFVEKFDPYRPCCIVLELRMPEMNGIETLIRLRERSKTAPVIFLTGYGDLSTVVRAMKLGAVDFFEKPVKKELLLESIQHWILYDIEAHRMRHERQFTLVRLAKLSNRERQVLECVLNGMSNKETARHLGVSPKTIEVHRANIMQKMEVNNAVKLAVEVVDCLRLVHQSMVGPSRLDVIEQVALAI